MIQFNDPYQWIRSAAQETPHHPCLEDDFGRRLDYAQVDQAAGLQGAALLELGVRTGDRVAFQVEKSLDAILVYLACLRVGAVVVPLNTAYTATELAYFLADSQPALFLARPSHEDEATQVATDSGCSQVETLGTRQDGSFAARIAKQRTPAPVTAVDPSGLAALLYTSGTTGRSKGAMITRGNLIANAQALATAWRLVPADRLVHTLPLFHVHGLFLSLNAVFAAHASVRVHDRFEPLETIESLGTATLFMGVPTHYTRLLASAALTPESVRPVRLFVSGSAPLLAETHQAFESRTGKAILERYGMTETLVNTSNPYDGMRKPGSVGLPLPGVEVRITEATRESENQAIGMIEVRGPNVCAGYWRAPEKTAADRTADGFFRTGDLGLIDADGYLHISGRAKDLVITGGYNVYPKEIELALDALPGISESAVFGVPHPDFGEGVTAAVTLVPDFQVNEQTVLAALKDCLAAYKVPKRLVVIAELPRNSMGKVQKNRLREIYCDLYGN
ncbi:MAG: AMP-binding protein [Pseudomonadota bacterium]